MPSDSLGSRRALELDRIDTASLSDGLCRRLTELYPICRSITGDGVRETLRILQREIPLEIREVASGTAVFDWNVPKEWNIRGAFIRDSAGRTVVDFRNHNLHVVNYSVPVDRRMSLQELKKHIHTLPDRPDWIPYRTSYYSETWGFCMSHRQFESLEEGEYEVRIDSSLADGSLSYGELLIPGATSEEVLISCHVCHPSLCNDNLSGISIATQLAKELSRFSLRYSYRFLFIPGTIGSITWLAHNEAGAERIRHGMVLTCVGDAGASTYKKSRRGDAEIDRAFAHVLKYSGAPFEVVDFSPYGYDERQFCSPGFNLAVGCLMRSPHGTFPEYHTSADNLDFVKPFSLVDTLAKCVAVLHAIEHNGTYVNQNPKCEPRLGKRGLYKVVGGQHGGMHREMALLWTLSLCDGSRSLLEVAERADLPFDAIWTAVKDLVGCGLLLEKQA
ncbi:MAG: DUF4910 domain-containing protein [Panacagrimonas sp.]